MPVPSATIASPRPDLAKGLEQFDLAADRHGFVGLKLFPVIEVAAVAGVFPVIEVASLLQNRETRRASSTGYARGDYKFTTDSWACLENGAEEPIDARERTMYADFLDAELNATARAFDIVLRNYERRIAAKLFNATTFSGKTAAVSKEWSVFADAQPVNDVETAVRAVWNATGLWPNSLTISRMVFRNLRQCAQIIDRVAGLGAGSATKASDITPAMLAQVFDLENVFVAGSAKNSAKEGQTATIAEIWDDEYALIGRVCQTSDIREPGLGRTFHWGADGSSIGGTVESYWEEAIRSDVIRVRHDTDEKLLYAGCGYLLSNITA